MTFYKLFLLLFFIEISQNSFAQRGVNNYLAKEPRSGFVLIHYPKVEGEKSKYYFIYDHEVSVRDYQEFLSYLKKEQKYDILTKVQPDSTKWIFGDKLPFREYFYSKKYATYPYSNYPIVCVSYEAAVEYCKWLEVLINNSKKETRTVTVRLPTNFEWVNSIYFSNKDAIYATRLKDKLIEDKQYYLANFKNESQIYTKKKGVLIPLRHVNSFNPLDGGMFNMSGNVAEMILSKGKIKGGHWNSVEEELKIVPVNSFDEPSVFVGFRPVMYYVENPD